MAGNVKGEVGRDGIKLRFTFAAMLQYQDDHGIDLISDSQNLASDDGALDLPIVGRLFQAGMAGSRGDAVPVQEVYAAIDDLGLTNAVNLLGDALSALHDDGAEDDAAAETAPDKPAGNAKRRKPS